MMQNYNLIKSSENRRCRPETLLRLLISTSYPQSTFSELALLLTEATVKLSSDDLEADASFLRSIEKSFDMLDFIRCIDISKYEDSIKLRIKFLDFDPTAEKIVDSKETHVTGATVSLPAVTLTELHLEHIVHYLLKLFYSTQRRSKNGQINLDLVKWFCRTRTRVGAGNTVVEDIKPDLGEVKEIIKESLRKPIFNLILTQNALLLTDQFKRIWFQNK